MSNMEDIRNFVTQGYRDILKREPDPGGLEHYVNYISSGGITRDRFLEILRTSEEYISLGVITKDSMEDIKNFVTQGYRDILKREPDPGGFGYYINEISLGKITRYRFLDMLRTSEEYRNRLGMVKEEKLIIPMKEEKLIIPMKEEKLIIPMKEEKLIIPMKEEKLIIPMKEEKAVPITTYKHLINNKICAILAHGRSLEELEKKINEFKDFDIVWCGMNSFVPSEGILKKINKGFTVVFDSATVRYTVAMEYEKNERVPRLTEFLARPIENIYITLKTRTNNPDELKESPYELRGIIGNFNERFKEKIIYGEDLGIDPNKFCVTIHLYISCLLKLGAKKIVLFGADGGGINPDTIESYYKPELALREKILADALKFNMSGDTNNVNSTFSPIMQQVFGYIPEIINCSPISNYTVFRKMDYDETINWLKENIK